MQLGGLRLPDVCQNIGAERINTEKPPVPPVARTEKSAIARDLAVLPLSFRREGRGERSAGRRGDVTFDFALRSCFKLPLILAFGLS